MLRRRQFLEGSAWTGGIARGRSGTPSALAEIFDRREITADVVIVGAAWAAARRRWRRCEPVARPFRPSRPTGSAASSPSQAVPPDEHPWIEQFGANDSYRRLRQGHPSSLPAAITP